jgi:hypothetical protein
MSQTSEANAFIQRITALPPGPGVSLDGALQPSLDDEAELRRLFATDKTNTRLANPYVGLVDVFNAPIEIRTTRARVAKDEVDLSAQYVRPLSDTKRRKEGTPATVFDLNEFKKNWGVFTENSLSQLFDWNNVVAAGGAVLACLSPLPDHASVSKRAIRKYFHSAAYPTSDVDIFLWGLTPEQARVFSVSLTPSLLYLSDRLRSRSIRSMKPCVILSHGMLLVFERSIPCLFIVGVSNRIGYIY